MATNEGWGRRLRDAKADWEKDHDRPLGYREIGVLVARELGLDKPVPTSTAHGWFKGQEPESWDQAFALERVLGKPLGSLVLPADPVRYGPDTLNGIDRVSHPDPDAESNARGRAEGE